jgi:uncharacterized protein
LKTIAKLCWSLCCLLCWLSTTAQDISYPNPQNPPKLVNDFDHILSSSEVQSLENKLVAFDKESSTQINIILLDSVGNIDIADYATEIGNRWGIGRKGKDNGVVLLAAIKEHKVNISTGYGVEGSLPDVMCMQIIANEIGPNFRNSAYYTGLDRATDAIIAATKGKYKMEGAYGNSGGGLPRWLIILLLIIGIPGSILFISWLFRWLWEKITGKKIKRRAGNYDYYTPTTTTVAEPKPTDNNSSSGSSNENFGGYGGGSFGGGGASGSW